jgi:CDP-glycerol glycerophosphotransferase
VAARISVVVPVYNVEPYLEACLEALERQTVTDLEVVMVNDGSTDASPEIAALFAARDSRFRLVHQENAGLGAARNTGVAHATGEFLIFADSDDVVPRHAYELLLGALDTTGSDFACGNVRRLTSFGTTRAAFLARAFERTRLQTHITRFPYLIADRTAWNKLFRRSFWDRHDFRFPEGVFYEDTPVMLPAHYLAGSVDVIRQTVYLWRTREGDDFSITQRRAETKPLRDRVAAVEHVSRFLEAQGLLVSKALYDRSVIGHDLRYFLDALPRGGDEYRQLFIELANEFMSRADSWVLDQPFAIDRVKWELVRRRALPELLEVLRFEEEEMSEVPPVRGRRRWYGDYPFRHDDRLDLPARAYRLDNELAPIFRIENIRWEGEKLRVDGYAYITMVGAPEPDSQTVELLARRRAWRGQTVQFETESVFRPDVTATAAQQLAGLDWCGFTATVDAARLVRGARGEDSWNVGVVIRTAGVERSSWRPDAAPLHPLPFRETKSAGRHVSAGFTRPGKLVVQVERRRASVRSCRVEGDVLELEGETGAAVRKTAGLQLSRRLGGTALRYPVYVGAAEGSSMGFLARVPLMDLVRAPEEQEADEVAMRRDGAVWEVLLTEPGRDVPLAFPGTLSESRWTVDGREVALELIRGAGLALAERSLRPVITQVRWSSDGSLQLAGTFAGPAGEYEVSLRGRRDGETHSYELRYDTASGAFTAELRPGAVLSFAGVHPLPEGLWDFLVAPRGTPAAAVAPSVSRKLLDLLPASTLIGGKPFQLGVNDGTTPVLSVERDLADGERGGFAQRTLRTSFYQGERRRGLRDAVVYDSFGGAAYSDSPRAIHEELVSREAQLEHLWVVRDAAFDAPSTARALREGSEEYYEALARARYVVTNDCWPRWFTSRRGQTCLQTWHGAPLKRNGLALADRPKAVRAYWRVLSQRAENWQLVLSPAAFATPIIRQAFPAGEILETGLPRTDVLFHPDRERIAEEVTGRLGLSGKRVVLYAPSYLDHLEYRSPERVSRVRDVPTYAADADDEHAYRQGALLDLEALGEALGSDHTVLFRKHRRVLDRLPASAAPFALDVSDYPDVMELLLVADVLITDYSSLAFDFACTGRPIVFFTPTLEEYRDDVRGFAIDFEADAPGPLLGTSEEVIDALRDLEGVRSAYGDRYESFAETYCGLSDGHAAERVVDRVFYS